MLFFWYACPVGGGTLTLGQPVKKCAASPFPPGTTPWAALGDSAQPASVVSSTSSSSLASGRSSSDRDDDNRERADAGGVRSHGGGRRGHDRHGHPRHGHDHAQLRPPPHESESDEERQLHEYQHPRDPRGGRPPREDASSDEFASDHAVALRLASERVGTVRAQAAARALGGHDRGRGRERLSLDVAEAHPFLAREREKKARRGMHARGARCVAPASRRVVLGEEEREPTTFV